MIFRKLRYLIFPNEDSLKSKLLFSFTIYYVLSCLIIFLGIYIYQFFYIGTSLNLIYSIILKQVIYFFIFLFFLRLFLSMCIEKHFLKRIYMYSSDAKLMIKKSSSKRLSIRGSDEIDRLAFYTNNILERYENLLELEKKNSLIDPLTMCYNRRALDLNFLSLKEKSIRTKKEIALVLFDIDNFKKVNDVYGHNIGDKVLIELSKTIRGVVRTYDSVYRVGGEEFLILLPNLKKKETNKFIIRLMREITYQLKKKIPKITTPITVSGGFVSSKDFDLNSNTILADMMVHADVLLYNAKSNGKNKILVK